MQLGLVGLGRMGADMVLRVIRKGHECVVFDMSPKAIGELLREKAVGTASLAELVAKPTPPHVRSVDGSSGAGTTPLLLLTPPAM